MSRSYAFHQPPDDLSRSLARQVSATDELNVAAHARLPLGAHPVSPPALARVLRRRRWPGHRISAFLASLGRSPDKAPAHPGPGLRRSLTRAQRRHDHQDLSEHYVEEME